ILPARERGQDGERPDSEFLRRRGWRQLRPLRLGTTCTMFSFGSTLRSARNPLRGLVRRREMLAAGLLAFLAGWTTAAANAQSAPRGRYFPLDQTTPTGVAAQWSTIRPGYAPVMQPVRIEMAGQGGQVGVYTGPDDQPALLPAPAVVGLRVGSTY